MLWKWPFWRGFLAFAVLASTSASPQTQSSQPPVFRAERNEVQVVVIVRDRNGHPVSDLKQTDFEILDSGKPQAIRSFSLQGGSWPELQTRDKAGSAAAAPSNRPLQRRFIGLFFDDINTEPGDFARLQKAGEQFIQAGLQPEDRIALFKSSERGADATFSNNKPKLLAEIEDMTVHPLGFQTRTSDCPKLSAYEAWVVREETDPQALQVLMNRVLRCYCPPPANSCMPPPPEVLRSQAQAAAEDAWNKARFASETTLASLDSAVHLLATMQGPRVLVLASSGFLTGDLERDVNVVIDNALRGGITVNSLSAKGLATEGSDADANLYRNDYSTQEQVYEHMEVGARAVAEEAAMTDLAESTGGKYFKNNNDLLAGFSSLASPETAYVLSFSPEPLKHDGKFHKLKVSVKNGGHYSIQARQGYFAPTAKKIEASGTLAASSTASPSAASATNTPAAVLGSTGATPPVSSAPPSSTRSAAPEPVTPAHAPEVASAISTSKPATAAASAASADAFLASGPAASAERLDFLTRASRQVEHYIETFADLTADESREMVSFSVGGHQTGKRTMQSELVIYRLRTAPQNVVEYRDVKSVDGHEIKGHAERAAKMWREMAKARSPQDEVKLVKQDSERYDIGLEETGFTLYEGLPLRHACAAAFVFGEAARGSEDGRPTRVFNYVQKGTCNVISYNFALPRPFASIPPVHSGQLVLDAETAQIIREERNVYLGSLSGRRVAHVVLDYAGSPFDVLVPKTIVIELFGPPEQVANPLYMPSMSSATPNGGEPPGPLPGSAGEVLSKAKFVLKARMIQTYGPFSRFEVNVVEKTNTAQR